MSTDVSDWLPVLAVVALLALAGCSGAGGGSDSATGPTQSAESVAFDGKSESAGPASGGDSGGATSGDVTAPASLQLDRQLIRTGTVAVEVPDFDRARRNLTRAVRGSGGYVSDTTVEVDRYGNETRKRGELVVRVPKANFSAMVERAERVGEVRKSSTKTKDVTDQLVDIEARLENLNAQRETLRALYANASDTEAVLEVQKELSNVQTEIERLEAQRKSLRQQVAYSTLTVGLTEERPDTPAPDYQRWHEKGLGAAFLESVDGVVVTARAVAVATAMALPYLFVFGVPLVALVGIVFRRR